MKSFKNYKEIKKSEKYVDWMTTLFCYPVSTRIVFLIQNTGITPNQLTVFSLLIVIFTTYFIFLKGEVFFLRAAFLFYFAFVIDNSDGTLARYKKIFSPFGPWLDSITDRIKELFIFGCITYQFSLVNEKAIFWGFYSLFLVYQWHGKEVAKFPLNEEKTRKEIEEKEQGIFRKINIIRRKIRFVFFSAGDQNLLLPIFLVLKRLDLFFYVFCIYGTLAMVIYYLNKWRQYNTFKNNAILK